MRYINTCFTYLLTYLRFSHVTRVAASTIRVLKYSLRYSDEYSSRKLLTSGSPSHVTLMSVWQVFTRPTAVSRVPPTAPSVATVIVKTATVSARRAFSAPRVACRVPMRRGDRTACISVDV